MKRIYLTEISSNFTKHSIKQTKKNSPVYYYIHSDLPNLITPFSFFNSTFKYYNLLVDKQFKTISFLNY